MIEVKMTPQRLCVCYGCQTAVELVEGGAYCVNKESPWYLCSTTCRCPLREPRENERGENNAD